jgi:hypothetical protein
VKEYTFGQAKQMLARAPYLHGTADIGELINNAVSALAGLNGWEFLRRLVRMFSPTPVISLPQGVAGLTRICLNGRPASIHGTDYQFMHSGPGDLDGFLRRGFRLLPGGDLADLGYSPIMVPMPAPMHFAATSAHYDDRPQAPITVSGLTPNGERATLTLDVGSGQPGVAPDYAEFHADAATQLINVESVVLDAHADDYITLWGMDQRGVVRMLGHYHPSVQVPKFRQYRISAGPGPYDILAEARIDPLPLVNDEDVVPIPSLEPIRLMMLYEHQIAMNELQSAQQYMQQAVQWLQQMQVADNTVQTPVVQNTLFEGSGGDVEPSWNL